MEHYSRQKGRCGKPTGHPAEETAPGGTMSGVVLRVLGCRERLLCKAQEIIKKGWFEVTPPAKTWGAAASAYGREKLEGFTAQCTVKGNASRWHRETINPCTWCRIPAGPVASSPAAILPSPSQHRVRCSSPISTIILH